MRSMKVAYVFALSISILPAMAFETLTCISDAGFKRCDLAQADQRDIRIKSVKSGDCDRDNAWGVDSSGIWVDKGCGAVFEYTSVSSGASSNDEGNPAFFTPYFGPGFYYGAGFYEENGWNNNDYCNNNHCNQYQNHQNDNENHDNNDFHGGNEGFSNFHGGNGGFHGGGGRR